jgi:hypothetical protein
MLQLHKFTNNYTSSIKVANEIKINSNTTIMLKLFFKHLQESEKSIQINSYEVIPLKKFPRSGNHFLPTKILSSMKATLHFIHRYEFVVSNRIVILQFMTNSKSTKCHKYAEMVYMWLYIVTKYSFNECSKKLNVDIFLSKEEKVLPKIKKGIINPINVNSGYTYGLCRSENHIVIYRKEEWFKVFIHETFHSFALDAELITNKKLDKRIKNIFPINCEININENYCETWAIIWNSLFHSYLRESKSINLFLKIFKNIYSYECSFSYYQMNKILKHMGLEYYDLYENTIESSDLRNKLYREGTNVFSYYILKANTMQNINDFLLFCNTQKSILLFNNSTEKYYQFIFNNFQSFQLTMINNISNPKISNSLRMSLFDFE